MLTLPSFVEKDFKNHIFESTQDEYHAIKDAVHSSSLKNISTSPHAYKYFLEHQKPITKSMKFGTLAHEAILEGSLFLSKYVVEPVFHGLTKDGKPTTSKVSSSVKEQYNEWLTSLPKGAEIITQEEYDKIRWMMDSLLSHKFVQDVLKDGFPEHKMMWRDPVTGLKCVCSHDFISYKNDIWVDIKTTTDPKWERFRKTGVERLDYADQAAFYDRGIKAVHGKSLGDRVWIAIQNVAPWEVRVHYVDPYYMEVGEFRVKSAMSTLRTSIVNNSWPQGQVAVEAGEPSSFYREEYDPILSNERAGV